MLTYHREPAKLLAAWGLDLDVSYRAIVIHNIKIYNFLNKKRPDKVFLPFGRSLKNGSQHHVADVWNAHHRPDKKLSGQPACQ
jgi:hypothetical protein